MKRANLRKQLLKARSRTRARAKAEIDRWQSVELLIIDHLLSQCLSKLRKYEKDTGKTL